MRNGDFVIRPVMPDDAARLAVVSTTVWRQTYNGIMPDAFLASIEEGPDETWHTHEKGWRGHLATSPAHTGNFALTAAGEIVGFGVCGPAKEALMGADAEIISINIVQGPARKARAGCALMAAMASYIRDTRAFRSMGLWALGANAPGLAFYERLGGTIVHRRPIHFTGLPLEDVAFHWPEAESLHATAHAMARDAGWR